MSTIRTGSHTVHTLDLNFQGAPGAIATYCIPHRSGVTLVECGPGSTLDALEEGLKAHGRRTADITDVLLTHIHLDHAGAAGKLASLGARIHVHPVGAPHLINPEKLLASAERIYGDQMYSLWGEFLPVPPERLQIVEDNQIIEIEDLRFQALDTPGHAYHHHCYIFEDLIFTGDVGGVRIGGIHHIRMPMPPPEFNLELWRTSLFRLQQEYHRTAFNRLAPTHFGIYNDPGRHFQEALDALDEVESWMQQIMPSNPPIDQLIEEFIGWTRERSIRQGVDDHLLDPLEKANPSWMSAYGIQRYWTKTRTTA